MRLQDKFKIGSWLTSNTGRDFHWGIWDCNVFFVLLHDHLYGTTDADRVVGKYHDKRSGIRLLRDMGLTSAQWLHLKGYEKCTGTKRFKDGDVAIIDHKRYASVYFYFDGAFWTVQEDKELTGYHPDSVADVLTSWWRKDG